MHKHQRLSAYTLLCLLPLAACSSMDTAGGVFIPAGGSANLALIGAPQVSLYSDAAAPLPLIFQSGTRMTGPSAVASFNDSLAPGVTRLWNFDGSMTIIINNPSASPASVSYNIQGADVNILTSPYPSSN
ncbi:MAG: hypothetical protein ACREJO_13685 [Phycisphaerales bacterium]